MLTTESLTTAGFRFYPYHDGDPRSRDTKGLWQKRIANASHESLYFIHIEEHRDRDVRGVHPEHAAKIQAHGRYSIATQLYTATGLTLDLALRYDPEMSVESIEVFYEQAHKNLGCGLDPHN